MSVRGPLTLWLGLLFWSGQSTLHAQSPVADAAESGQLAAVRSALAAGAAVSQAQGDGMTALHWAAERGDLDMLQLLLGSGADVEAGTRIGAYRPLHLASRAGRGEAVLILLNAGADVAAASTVGGSRALHFAADAGDARVVLALLEHGAEVDAREEVWAQTALMFAAANNNGEAIRLLLDAGANLAATSKVLDIPRRQAADRAARTRRAEVLKRLRADQPARSGEGPTPAEVQTALRAARTEPPAKPAEEEENLNFEEVRPATFAQLVGAQGGLSALHHAAREGHLESVALLLEAGADIDQVTGGDASSPMLLAAINGHFDLVLVLLAAGADPNLASQAGTTPLYAVLNTHWAPKARYPQQRAYEQQEADYIQVMERLLEAGAAVNLRLKKHLWYMSYTFDLLGVDTRGATPFWRAAYATDLTAMRLLIANGADPEVPTIYVPGRRSRRSKDGEPDPSGLPPPVVGGPGIFPIHAASGVGYGEGYAGNSHRHVPDGWLPALRYLVEELGADVNARDAKGYTPLHHAAARGDRELILYLLERGANVEAISRRGQSVADMANGPVQRVQVFPEIVELLVERGSSLSKKGS
ncbi:MAG: ankyrin repeat domain-containing protein [Planctomycetota bacterium]|jgi:ankyrin repeat protein